MSFRFRRRINLLPGVRLNLAAQPQQVGVSASVGRRGFWFTAGPRGTRETVGIPGTGISYTEQQSSGTPPADDGASAPPASSSGGSGMLVFWLVVLLAMAVGAIAIWVR
jgi:hypothetical protein